MKCQNCDSPRGVHPGTRLCRRCGPLVAFLRAELGHNGDRYLSAAMAGVARAWFTQPAARWWDGTRACLHQPPPAVPCGYTRDDGIRWRCGRLAHDGDDHHDPAYGEFRGELAPSTYLEELPDGA